MKKNQIKLKLVSKTDYRFLYNLLKERDSRANISHKKMPTYNEHLKFIRSKPYAKWYIAEFGVSKIASVYLTSQNEIGIFIKKTYQNKKFGGIILSQLIQKNPRERYLANVSPKNKISENFFKSNGFKFIQKTYELTQTSDKR
jgi:RimJ/RimL family protein N-acetyltransferase